MSDTYLEYLVAKRSTGRDIALKLLIGVAAVVLSVVLVMVSYLLGPFSMIALLAAAGVIYGAYRLIGMLNLEYEYVLTNGDLDVDKVINRNSRKRLLTVKCATFETFGKFKEVDHSGKTYETRMFACSSPADPDVWYATFRHQKLGHTLLVFNANEKMLEGFKAFLPKQLAFEVFHRTPNA